MAKFKKGDRVRCVSDKSLDINVGKVYLVDGYEDGRVYFKDDAGCDRHRSAYRYELATPSPIPDTVTIGGVEYVRKPEPEHVWAWGQWARVNHCCRDHFNGQTCFVLGGADECGFIPVSLRGKDGKKETDGLVSACLTYLGTATVPE